MSQATRDCGIYTSWTWHFQIHLADSFHLPEASSWCSSSDRPNGTPRMTSTTLAYFLWLQRLGRSRSECYQVSGSELLPDCKWLSSGYSFCGQERWLVFMTLIHHGRPASSPNRPLIQSSPPHAIILEVKTHPLNLGEGTPTDHPYNQTSRKHP